MDVTQVIIHFVGLALFSASVPNDPGVHAILPRITSSFHRHERIHVPEISQARMQSLPHIQYGSGVEDHVAMLVYPAAIEDPASPWKGAAIPGAAPALSSYKQVTLNGEHVRFLADGPNHSLTALPQIMPRFTCPMTNGVKPPLTASYQWPYAEAAAVVDIPEGVLQACKPGAVAVNRIDTKLTLQTAGKLYVMATKAGVAKTLVLKTDTRHRIYLLNVPGRWARGDTLTASTGESHYVAYYGMVGRNKSSGCSGAPALAAGESITTMCGESESQYGSLGPAGTGGPQVVGRYATAALSRPAAGASSTPPPPPTSVDLAIGAAVANAECSNSAWP